ncbi:hypothetical protein GGQ74_001956 [Desulfobaculum xiamenense]|uniref:AMMECR1 domain-containing protein n=1 Tax=Desulfobaculum xiamenense TaxID=995050 RepID=A0A846QPP1_9BACT|nr:AmmeMemoRadiSam system protein A [Desulfobaculum xiamenense]NJB68283.1 hypothetical protein [Desulfobaculum xiamenense]
MPERFSFTLTDEEKTALKGLVRRAIASRLETGRAEPAGEPPTPRLLETFGAFVTLTLGGQLRGCIGRVIGDRPLWTTVHAMAQEAAFGDPRFSPLTAEEFGRVEIEISILSQLTVCPNPELVTVGRHGLLISHRGHSGLLLPQVPVEWGWDRETFLKQTCHKAGLPPDSWQEPGAQIFWFEAEVF